MKKCYLRIARHARSIQNGTVHWKNDGKNGDDEPNNSEALLVDWLTTGHNYDTYSGAINGKRKDDICSEIAEMINQKGVHAHRTSYQVMKKITSLEEVLVKAFEWTSSAGAGLKATNPQGFIWHVKNMCPLYDNLYPVMVTRAKTQHIRNRDDEYLLAGERSSNNEEDDSERSPDEERAGPAEIEEGNTSTAGIPDTIIITDPTSPARSAQGIIHNVLTSNNTKKKRKAQPGSLPSRTESAEQEPMADGFLEFAQETKRHNMKMEEMQQEKLQLGKTRKIQEDWIADHDFRMKLFRDFLNLRKQNVSDCMIRKNFPAMAPFLDNSSSSDEE